MDFAYHYTDEQERFRAEVSAWLDAQDTPANPSWAQLRRLRLALGGLGWLAPSEPTEDGGAGMTPDHAVVVMEELDKRGLLAVFDDTGAQLRRALRDGGSDGLRRELLPSLAAGGAVVWRMTLDPHAEPDAASLGVRARPDGDGFILNGEAAFSGDGPEPSHLWTLAGSEQDDSAIIALVVAASLLGVSVRTPRNLADGTSHHAEFADVWVPRNAMLGDESDGWRLTRSAALDSPTLDLPPPEVDRDTAALLAFARNTTHEGKPLSEEPVRRMLLVEAYIDSRLSRLLAMRNQWRRTSGLPMGYEQAQSAMLRERAALRLSRITQDVAGVYALLDADDPRAAGASFAAQQRESVAGQNPTGMPDARRRAMAEAIGMGERARPGKRRS